MNNIGELLKFISENGYESGKKPKQFQDNTKGYIGVTPTGELYSDRWETNNFGIFGALKIYTRSHDRIILKMTYNGSYIGQKRYESAVMLFLKHALSDDPELLRGPDTYKKDDLEYINNYPIKLSSLVEGTSLFFQEKIKKGGYVIWNHNITISVY